MYGRRRHEHYPGSQGRISLDYGMPISHIYDEKAGIYSSPMSKKLKI